VLIALLGCPSCIINSAPRKLRRQTERERERERERNREQQEGSSNAAQSNCKIAIRGLGEGKRGDERGSDPRIHGDSLRCDTEYSLGSIGIHT